MRKYFREKNLNASVHQRYYEIRMTLFIFFTLIDVILGAAETHNIKLYK